LVFGRDPSSIPRKAPQSLSQNENPERADENNRQLNNDITDQQKTRGF